MEAQGYAVGSAVLPATSVGAPHKRDRLWFVANRLGYKEHKEQQRPEAHEGRRRADLLGGRSVDCGEKSMGHHHHQGLQGRGVLPERGDERTPWSSGVEWLQCADEKARLVKSGIRLLADGYPNRRVCLHIAGDSIVPQVAAEFIKAYIETLEDGTVIYE